MADVVRLAPKKRARISQRPVTRKANITMAQARAIIRKVRNGSAA